jgi:hypothetical protein
MPTATHPTAPTPVHHDAEPDAVLVERVARAEYDGSLIESFRSEDMVRRVRARVGDGVSGGVLLDVLCALETELERELRFADLPIDSDEAARVRREMMQQDGTVGA